MDLKALSIELLADPWFRSVPEARRNLLLSIGRRVDVTPGQHVYRLGDSAKGLYAVLKGEVRLISYPANGKQAVSLQLGPGQWFGELSVIDGEPRPHDAIVQATSRLLFIAIPRFEAMARQCPDIVRDLARLLASRQRAAVRYAEQMAYQGVDVRLAKLLIAASQALGACQTSNHVKPVALTQDALATRVGASRQTVNRYLKIFESRGLVELQYGKVVIRDLAGLERWAFPVGS